jgi:hypothetical protein
MVNYSNGKIYIIESHLGDKIYIGSTTKEYLSQRMAKHKHDYTYFKKWRADTGFAFVTSYLLFDEYGVDNCKIELLETYYFIQSATPISSGISQEVNLQLPRNKIRQLPGVKKVCLQ